MTGALQVYLYGCVIVKLFFKAQCTRFCLLPTPTLSNDFFAVDVNETRPRGYKTFFMLNSAETKIYPAHKC